MCPSCLLYPSLCIKCYGIHRPLRSTRSWANGWRSRGDCNKPIRRGQDTEASQLSRQNKALFSSMRRIPDEFPIFHDGATRLSRFVFHRKSRRASWRGTRARAACGQLTACRNFASLMQRSVAYALARFKPHDRTRKLYNVRGGRGLPRY